MKLVVDANTLTSDLYLAGPSFTVIANEIAGGELELIVPEVSVIETVGNFRRSIDDAHSALERFSAKWSRLLHEASKLDEFDGYLGDLAVAYDDTLRERLDGLGARIEPIPEIEHAQLVRRAAERRRPCDANGNGYRDSLIWETVLVVAAEGEDVVFVTNDTDFTLDEEGDLRLHPDLVADMQEAALDVEITIVSDLHTAIRQYLVHEDAEVADLAHQVRLELLNEWLQDAALYEEAVHAKVDPKATGLPRTTTSAEIEYVEDVADVADYSLLRKLGDSVLIEFEVRADAAIDLWVDEWEAEDLGDVRLRDSGRLGQVQVQMVKPLNFDCLVALDTFGRPESLEITRVHVDEDDPGVMEWNVEICGCIRPPRD